MTFRFTSEAQNKVHLREEVFTTSVAEDAGELALIDCGLWQGNRKHMN